MTEELLSVAGKPSRFFGSVRLPPSKSYLHRALFVASLATGSSTITNCGNQFSDDVEASIGVLRSLGVSIRKTKDKLGTLHVSPGDSETGPQVEVDARGSGTTARFAISFAALTKSETRVRIIGNKSLTKRPMGTLLEALSELGVTCYSEKSGGRLPVVVEGGGIRGGVCTTEGTVSSQFISSLLMSCAKAKKDTTIWIKKPSKLVSRPYIEATLKLLSLFGFKIKPIVTRLNRFKGFEIKGNQIVQGGTFEVPGDMSGGASLIGAAIACGGRLNVLDFNRIRALPQSDMVVIRIAKILGAKIRSTKGILVIKARRDIRPCTLSLNLRDSPDLVPVVAGITAACGSRAKIKGVAHLRFKESDRLEVLSREFNKIGMKSKTGDTFLSLGSRISEPIHDYSQMPVVLDPENDHRMLMAFTIAGLSGKFGELQIRNPNCVEKSYPSFVKDLQRLCHEKKTIRVISK
jgi:3-phosphoshikimate 1-carboxyvinyltransferase